MRRDIARQQNEFAGTGSGPTGYNDAPRGRNLENLTQEPELTYQQRRDTQAYVEEAVRKYFDTEENLLQNTKFKADIGEYAEAVAANAALKAETEAAEIISRINYIKKETLVPPKENLNIVDLNLANNFIKNPGTGPFVILALMFAYRGLVEDVTDRKQRAGNERPDTQSFENNQRVVFKVLKRSRDVSMEEICKIFTDVTDTTIDDAIHTTVSKFGEISTTAQQNEEKIGDYLQKVQTAYDKYVNGNNISSQSQSSGTDSSFLTADLFANQLDSIQNMEISSPWHIAILPLAMLVIQFSYLFFIFYEAYNGYDGGTCPAYESPQAGPIPYPSGGDVISRIVIAFVAAFFCIRVLQQFLLFAHALEGQNRDDLGENRAAFKYGFMPLLETWRSTYEKAESMLDNASTQLGNVVAALEYNLRSGEIRQDKCFGVANGDELESGIKAYIRAMHENIRNLRVLSYDHEKQYLGTLQTKLEYLENFCVTHQFLTVSARAEIRHRVLKDYSDEQRTDVKKRKAEDMGWRNVKWSWILPFYVADCVVQLILLICIFLVNLYIVFVDGVAARDMILNVLMLDFIYDQLPKFKRHIFKSEKAKALVRTFKIAYSDPPRSTMWKMQCRFARALGLQSILIVSFLAFSVSFAMIIYGPLCKPGPAKAGQIPTVKET